MNGTPTPVFYALLGVGALVLGATASGARVLPVVLAGCVVSFIFLHVDMGGGRTTEGLVFAFLFMIPVVPAALVLGFAGQFLRTLLDGNKKGATEEKETPERSDSV